MLNSSGWSGAQSVALVSLKLVIHLTLFLSSEISGICYHSWPKMNVLFLFPLMEWDSLLFSNLLLGR